MTPTNENFSAQGFWSKLRGVALYIGREGVEKVLMLYYAAQRPETPVWAKTVIYTALAYFILPADAIPDFIPFAGYSDDWGALATALATVAACITPEVKEAAHQQANQWFGDEKSFASQADTSYDGNPIREIPID